LRREIGFFDPLGSLEGGNACRWDTGTRVAREKKVVAVVFDCCCLVGLGMLFFMEVVWIVWGSIDRSDSRRPPLPLPLGLLLLLLLLLLLKVSA